MPLTKTGADEKLNALYHALQDYIESVGGSVVVAGGVEVRQIPGDEFRYETVIRCTGKPPRRD